MRSPPTIRPGLGPLLLLTLLGYSWPTDSAAQSVTEIEASSPPPCDIRLHPTVTLGDKDGPGIVAATGIIAVDSEGRFYVAHGAARGHILVFDSAGEFLTRTGRPGAGPGEYRVVGAIEIGNADSVLVFDNGNARLTVLTPYPTLEVARTQTIPIPVRSWEGVIDSDGGYVTAFPYAEPGRIGYPVHEVGPDGRVGRSFGSEEPRYRPGKRLQLRRVIAAGGDHVWVGHRSQYVVERWHPENERIASFGRRVSWFPTIEEIGAITPDNPPPTTMTAIQEGPGGYLWVLIAVPSEDWLDGLRRAPGPEGRAFYEVVSSNDVFSTVLEILDPGSATLIASERFGHELLAFLSDGRILGYREDEVGFPYLDVLRAEIKCPLTHMPLREPLDHVLLQSEPTVN